MRNVVTAGCATAGCIGHGRIKIFYFSLNHTGSWTLIGLIIIRLHIAVRATNTLTPAPTFTFNGFA